MSKDVRVNRKIITKEVRLIDDDGGQLGVVTIQDALKRALEKELDLVEVAPNAVPPVCKIMDFGKYKYQMSKKHTVKKTMEIKEVKLRPRIDEHDLQLKARNINRFIEEGHKSKVTMFFRGRERARPELGMKVYEKLATLLTGEYTVVQPPKMEGNSITMVVAPK